jgi:hypothetical protein
MRKPRLLDLYSGAGGAARGYQMAGFHVTGVDIKAQPRYCGDEFIQGDALEYLEAHGHEYDAIHASPPCQAYANVTRWRGDQSDHPELVLPTIELLKATGKPWAVENVEGAPFTPDLILCGSMFGLPIKRHRWFLTSWGAFDMLMACNHKGILPFMHKGERAFADAMGCYWMNNREGREAIPPAFTNYIGRHLLAHATRPPGSGPAAAGPGDAAAGQELA